MKHRKAAEVLVIRLWDFPVQFREGGLFGTADIVLWKSTGLEAREGVRVILVWHPAHLCGGQTDSFTHLTAKDMQAQRGGRPAQIPQKGPS